MVLVFPGTLGRQQVFFCYMVFLEIIMEGDAGHAVLPGFL